MDGTYPTNTTFSFNNNTQSANQLSNFVYDLSSVGPTAQGNITQPMFVPIQSKCKCPNPKHTNGCSIEPESEYCVWCAKGCVKRVQAIHVRYT